LYIQPATQQCQCSRITTLLFLENACACETTLALKVILLARNRLIGGVRRLVSWLFCFWKEVLVVGTDAVGQKSEDRPSQQGESTF
jgi:hypothetical protein